MNPAQRSIFKVPVFFLLLFFCCNVAYAKEKPEIIRLDARYAENLVKINIHWQSANPVALIHAVIGSETKEIRVDPYDNRRNPDGYEGESVVTFNISASQGATGIPYVVQIEDDLRQKSEQVTGSVNTVVAGGGGSGAGSEFWSNSDEWSSSGTGASSPGFQTGSDAWSKAKQGQPGELIDQVLDFAKGGGHDSGGNADGGQGGDTGLLTLQNDSGSVAGFLPLTPGDEVAVYLDNQGKPFTVAKVYFLFGGSPDTGVVTIKISEGAGTPGSLQILYSESFEVPGLDTDFQILDLANYGFAVPVQTGGVWISLQMGHEGLPGIGVDTSATSVAGRNWLREGGSWSAFQAAGVPGNAIIRVGTSTSQNTSQEYVPDSSQPKSADTESPSERAPQKPSRPKSADTEASSERVPQIPSQPKPADTQPPSEKVPQIPSGRTVDSPRTPVTSAKGLPAPVSESVSSSQGSIAVTDSVDRVVPAKKPSTRDSIRAGKASPAVTDFSPATVTLTRGGAEQRVRVQGSGLASVMVQVLKGNSPVQDVTALITDASESGCQVVLTAPSSGKSVGEDYLLKIYGGDRVIGQMTFAVGSARAPEVKKRVAPVKGTSGGIIRR